jgi:hypothetical protein
VELAIAVVVLQNKNTAVLLIRRIKAARGGVRRTKPPFRYFDWSSFCAISNLSL